MSIPQQSERLRLPGIQSRTALTYSLPLLPLLPIWGNWRSLTHTPTQERSRIPHSSFVFRGSGRSSRSFSQFPAT